MLYKNERELQHELSTIDFEFLTGNKFAYTRREVPVGGCIPDLVSIQFTQEPKINHSPARWSYKHSFVIWLLRNWEMLSLEKMASITFEPIDRLTPIIFDLEAMGILQKRNSNNFILSSEIEELQASVIAAEAKLRNWRQALSQAKRYKDFANIVFVAMDATKVPKTKEAISEFRNEKVGLCAVAPGSIEWIIYPTMRINGLGHEREYLIMSAILPNTQTLWSRR